MTSDFFSSRDDGIQHGLAGLRGVARCHDHVARRSGYNLVHEGLLTLWRIGVLKGRHIDLFDRAALRREILRGVSALVRAKRSDPKKRTIPHFAC